MITAKNVTKEAWRHTVKNGVFNAILYGLPPISYFYFTQGVSPVIPIIGALFLGVYGEYLFFYRLNMEKHRMLYHREGQPYEQEMIAAVSDIGLGRMLRTHWFIKRYNKKWRY